MMMRFHRNNYLETIFNVHKCSRKDPSLDGYGGHKIIYF